MQPSEVIEIAAADAQVLGIESRAGVFCDAVRLCFASRPARDDAVALALNRLSAGQLAALQRGPGGIDPHQPRRDREAVFAALLEGLPAGSDAAQRRKRCLLHRHDWLREAARVAKRDWAACAREAGVSWVTDGGVKLLLQVRWPGVLVLTLATSARLVTCSCAGHLAEVDPSHDPE